MTTLKKQIEILREVRRAEDSVYEKTGLSLSITASYSSGTAQDRISKVNDIINAVCAVCCISPEQLRGDDRSGILPTARQVVSYLCGLLVQNVTFVEIARSMQKHHSAILYGITRTVELVEVNDELITDLLSKVLTKLTPTIINT